MDAIIGVLNNPLVLQIVGYIVSYAPSIRTAIPQWAIPLLNTILALVSSIVAPQAAHASGGPLVATTALVATFGLSWLGSVGTMVGAAAWQAVQASLIHRFFFRGVLPPIPADSKR
jgi:hypothetical protein